MLYGCQLEGHQTENPNHMHPCYISSSYPMLKLVHLAKHDPTFAKNTITFFFFIFGFVSILIPSSSSFYFATTFYLFFSCCDNLSASSLFTHLFILLKTNVLVNLLNFCTLGATQEEWKKRKCKG